MVKGRLEEGFVAYDGVGLEGGHTFGGYSDGVKGGCGAVGMGGSGGGSSLDHH